MREEARTVAQRLLQQLYAGTLHKIGIDEIRAELATCTEARGRPPHEFEQAVTRAVVEGTIRREV